jgi:hypothetical protein
MKNIIRKTEKFLDYYTDPKVMEALGIKDTRDIWLVENGSSPYLSDGIMRKYGVGIKRYPKHLTRTAHLEYPYCWRGLYYCRDLFQEYDYNKVIHLNNDVFIISEKLANYIRDYKEEDGWWCPWCPKHGFKECDLQVIISTCPYYWRVTSPPYLQYNGRAMENVIEASHEKDWIGDRHSEYGILEQQPGWDFSCQVKLDTKIEWNK